MRDATIYSSKTSVKTNNEYILITIRQIGFKPYTLNSKNPIVIKFY